jgi:hypothetical protein
LPARIGRVVRLGLLAFISLTCGVILDSVARGRVEMKRMAYLGLEAPGRTLSRR